jgi:hypothetical protein
MRHSCDIRALSNVDNVGGACRAPLHQILMSSFVKEISTTLFMIWVSKIEVNTKRGRERMHDI